MKENKKVGICTYLHENYGSCLQAFALARILEDMGFKACFFERKRTKMLALKYALISMFFYPKSFLEKFARKANILPSKPVDPQFGERKKKIQQFKRNRLSITECSKREMHNIGEDPDYVAFIAGSDQIWGGEKRYWTGYEFLTFAPDNKKIAYAPSVGTHIARYNYKKFKKCVPKFSALSVRETTAAKEILDIVRIKVKTVLDPTLLLNEKQWSQYAAPTDKDRKYILTYFLDDLSDVAVAHIDRLQRETGFDIINISCPNDVDKSLKIYKNIVASPEQWLGLMASASVICTDSFHGTAFAVNFHKKFYVYERQYKETSSQGSRIHDLLNFLGIDNVFVNDAEQIVDPIDWANVDGRIEAKRADSIKFLTDSLGSCVNGDNI